MKSDLTATVSRMASSLEALLRVQTKVADMVGNDEIRITKTRARELMLELQYINAAIDRNLKIKEPSYFDRLDRMEQMSKAEAAELAGCAE